MPAEKVEKKKSSASEIDDIFAKKTLPAKKQEATESSSNTAVKSKKKKKNAKPIEEDVKADENEEEEEPTHAVEEVVFAELTAAKQGQKRKAQALPPADDGFGDSRGKKSKRTTEEGYPLYDIKDLRIGEGKDTPDCPFDCDCCY